MEVVRGYIQSIHFTFILTSQIQQVSVVGKAGLGSSHPSALPLPDPWAEKRKKQLQVTQQRYNQQ